MKPQDSPQIVNGLGSVLVESIIIINKYFVKFHSPLDTIFSFLF